MAEVIYILCAATSCACAALLLRAYRRNKTRLLLWTCLGFAALALNNILLFMDLGVLKEASLEFWRSVTALAGIMFLVYGLSGTE